MFLHGFPGVEKNLDLAQAVRRAGWDVIYFDYRGTWGSGGTFSFAGSLEDVKTVLAWIHAPENAAEHHFDPERLAIIGHSFGGWLALMSAPQPPTSACVAVMAAWNIGWLAEHRDEQPAAWTATMQDLGDAIVPRGGPVRATVEALAQEVITAPPGWNYLSHGAALGNRALYLIAATNDTVDEDPAMHDRLAAAVRAAGGGRVSRLTRDDDHAFSASRVQLGEALVAWLNADCAKSQSAEKHD